MRYKILLVVSAIVGTTSLILLLTRFALKLHIKLKDRDAAAKVLAEILRGKMKNLRPLADWNQDILVLGIPRGGVIVADIVARELCADFNIVIGMKLGRPDKKEFALGALVEDNTVYLNEEAIDKLEITSEYIENELSDLRDEIERTIAMYRGRTNRQPYDLGGKSVVLIDDGAATGATLIAAARSIRKHKPRHLIIAAPVAPRETLRLLKREADTVEVISCPSISDFFTIGQFYEQFPAIKDEQIIEIMQDRKIFQS